MSQDRDNQRIIQLLEQILTKLTPQPAPVPNPYYPLYPNLPSDYAKAGCATCGMTFEGSIGYVCVHPECPTGVRC